MSHPDPTHDVENELEEDDESLCGNPSNHNNGDNEGCIECGIIKLNL